jgi:RND superfamily putative drug exporter
MAQYLYRLGTFAYRRHRIVLVGWLIVLGVTLGSSMLWSGSPTNGLDVPGTEAQQAIDTLQREFPQAAAGGASANVVVAAEKGETLAEPSNAASVSR